MNPVQYIIINKGLGMSSGKMAAQAAHASVEGVRLSAKTPGGNPWDSSIVNRWYRGGHYAKIVLEVEDGAALQIARQYIEDRGFKTALIIDEGRTEIEPMSVTALGCEIVDKDWPHARETFSAFKLYCDAPRPGSALIVEVPRRMRPEEVKKLRALSREELVEHFNKPYEGRPSWLQRATAKMNAKADKMELEAKVKKAMQEDKDKPLQILP